MQIVVLDSLPLDAESNLDWSPLRNLGDLVLHPQTDSAQIAERIGDADIVLTNKVPIRAPSFALAPGLKLISVLATGYNVIDTDTAKKRGVTVCNVPGYSTPSTAQTAVALLLELCNHVGDHALRVQGGEWQRRGVWGWWASTPRELDGKTLVVVGMGAVGQRVAQVLGASGMTVLAAQLPGRPAGRSGSPYPRVPLDEALRAADVVSLHIPLTSATQSLMNADRLARMKPTAFLVNTARGPLVEEAAVADALHAGRLAGYAADVLSVEPPDLDNPLLSAPNCLITPHYAWASPESRARLLDVTVENVRAFLAGTPRNVVT